MRGNVLHPLAINPNLAPITQALRNSWEVKGFVRVAPKMGLASVDMVVS
jgi:hypothetical protein